MAYLSPPVEAPYFRPKRIPRVLRKHRVVLRWCLGIAIVGGLLALVSWRKMTHDRLVLDVGMRYATLDSLSKRVQQLNALIEAETSFPRISRWAREEHGWRKLPERTRVLNIQESALSDAAREEAERIGAIHE